MILKQLPAAEARVPDHSTQTESAGAAFTDISFRVGGKEVHTTFFTRTAHSPLTEIQIVKPPQADRYQHMHAAEAMNDIVSRKISAAFLDPTIGKYAQSLCTEIRDRYPNTEQYHSGPHAQEVVGYNLRIAELARLPQDDLSKLKRVMQVYHDFGNARAPGVAGRDETLAAVRFLKHWAAAATNSADLGDESQAALRMLDAQSALEVSARMLGTVFRDRFANESKLAEQDYVKEFTRVVQEVRELGISQKELLSFVASKGLPATLDSLPLALAREMTSLEAVALKHADIAGSLCSTDMLKYTLVNAQEDARRENPITATVPSKYLDGFAGFITGKFHPADQPSALAHAIRQDPEAVFVGLGAQVAEFGRDKFIRWKEATSEILDMFATVPENNLLVHYHAMINRGVDVMSMSIAQMRDAFAKEGVDLSAYPGLNRINPALEHKTVPELPGYVVSHLFLPSSPQRVAFCTHTHEKEVDILGARALSTSGWHATA